MRSKGLRVRFYGKKTVVYDQVRIIEDAITEEFDVVLAAVRRDQIESAADFIGRKQLGKVSVLMANYPCGIERIKLQYDSNSPVFAFPGAGGSILEDGTVHGAVLAAGQQKTTIGEADGRITSRVKDLILLFRKAGFPSEASENMDGWLKSHTAWIVPASAAVCAAGHYGKSLEMMPEVIGKMIDGIRENFYVLRKLGMMIEPGSLQFWEKLPRSTLIWLDRFVVKNPVFKETFIPHSLNAREEIRMLFQDLKELSGRAGCKTPVMDHLIKYV